MRQTEGIAAHFLQPFEPPFDQPIRHRHSNSGMVLMAVDTLDFDVFPIQEKSTVRVEANMPHAEVGGYLIDDLAGYADGAAQLVKTRIFQRPEIGLGQEAIAAPRLLWLRPAMD